MEIASIMALLFEAVYNHDASNYLMNRYHEQQTYS